MPSFMVTSPDGRKFRVDGPDGATQDDAIAYVQGQQKAAAPPTDEPNPRRQALAASNPAMQYAPDVLFGARQGVDALAQMATRGLEKIPAIADWAKGQRQNVEQVNQQALDEYRAKYGELPGSDVARGAGQSLLTLAAPIKAASSLLGAIGKGGALGGASAGLTPVYGAGDDFWDQKAGQVTQGAKFGAATGGIFKGASRALAPQSSPEVQMLMDAGVNPTPGQAAGGMFKRIEDAATSIPIIGDAIKGAQTRALKEFNQAVYQRALAPLGPQAIEHAKSLPAGQKGIAGVGDYLSDSYDNALAASVPNVVTPQFQSTMQSLAGMVPKAKQADFVSTINREIFDKITPGGTLTPSVAKQAESALGGAVRSYMGSSLADDRVFAQAVAQAQTELRNLVAQNNPAVAPIIQATNKGWATLTQLENAGAMLGAGKHAGVITPAQLMNAVKKGDNTVRDRAFARGEAMNQDLAQAGSKVLSGEVPDSGTPLRWFVGGLTGASAAPFMAANPHLSGPALAAALPYLPGAQKVAANLIARRPDMIRRAGDQVGGLAGYLAAPAGLLGLY